VLAPALTIVRLSLHVTAAAVWVGGQFTLAGLVPRLRALGPEATKTAAQGFARLAWPAYVVLVLTGMWNISAAHPSQQTSPWKVVLVVKIVVVVLAGVATLAHQRASSRRGLAVGGALSAATSIAALVLGVALAG
jgi:putative copper export protein